MDFDIHDQVGAWVPHGRFIIDGRPGGPLAGLRFGTKDLFDLVGHPTGAGNPTWLATRCVPDRHSPVVAQLLQAGATLASKLLTDELACSHCEIVRADHLRKVKDPAQNTTHVCRRIWLARPSCPASPQEFRMKSLVIALAFCAGSAMTGLAAANCDSHGSLDAKAPSHDKAVLAQTTVQPKAIPAVTTKVASQLETKAAAKAAVRVEVRKSTTL